jgi:hypothetical protein
MTFADMGPLVTLDLETNALFLDSPSDTTRYRDALDRLDQVALAEDQSVTFIRDHADHFDAAPHVNLPTKSLPPPKATDVPSSSSGGQLAEHGQVRDA